MNERSGRSAAGRLHPPPTALGFLEIGSIAVGYAVADALVQAAEVTLHEVSMVTPGKLGILFSGGVADLETAHAAGLRRAGHELLDELLLPGIDPQVVPLLMDRARARPAEALGLLESPTVASGIRAADAAAKASDIRLLDMRRARGIGGKTVTLLTGTVADVEVALEAGTRIGAREGCEIRSVLISGLHQDLRQFLLDDWGIGEDHDTHAV